MKPIPQFLNSSIPQFLNSSIPQFFKFFVLGTILLLPKLVIGQDAGSLSFSNPSYDSNTGFTKIEIYWVQNTITSIKGVNISLGIGGTSVCVDQTTSSIHSDFSSNTTFSNSSIVIQKFANQSFTILSAYTPLLTLFFRAAPGSTASFSFGIAAVRNSNNQQIDIVPPSNKLDVTVTDPININGIVRKYPGASAQCSGGVNAGITNVTMSVQYNGTACFTPYDAYSNYSGFPASSNNSYNFVSSTGQYSVDVPSHYEYTITPSKSSSCSCGLDEGDLETARALVYSIYSPNPIDPFSISTAEYLTLDFDGNGYITTFDLAAIQLCMLGTYNPPAGWSPWRFVPIAAYNSNNPPKYFPLTYIPSSITTAPVTHQLIFQDFYGFKRGDMDGSCTDCNNGLLPEIPKDRSADKLISYHLDQIPGNTKGEYDIFITLDEDIYGLTLYNLEFALNNRILDVLKVNAEDVSEEMFQTNLNVWNEKTPIKIMWLSNTLAGENLTKGQHLAHLRVKVLEEVNTSLSTAIETKNVNCFYRGGKEKALLSHSRQAAFNQFSIQLLNNGLIQDNLTGVVRGIQHNSLNLRLFDLQGKEVRNLTLFPDSVQQIFEMNEISHLPPGIYILCAQSGGNMASIRLQKW